MALGSVPLAIPCGRQWRRAVQGYTWQVYTLPVSDGTGSVRYSRGYRCASSCLESATPDCTGQHTCVHRASGRAVLAVNPCCGSPCLFDAQGEHSALGCLNMTAPAMCGTALTMPFFSTGNVGLLHVVLLCGSDSANLVGRQPGITLNTTCSGKPALYIVTWAADRIRWVAGTLYSMVYHMDTTVAVSRAHKVCSGLMARPRTPVSRGGVHAAKPQMVAQQVASVD